MAARQLMRRWRRLVFGRRPAPFCPSAAASTPPARSPLAEHHPMSNGDSDVAHRSKHALTEV